MPTAKLKITGLSSAEDEKLLQESVRRLPGVYGAVASRSNLCMEVDFEDDEVNVSDILEAASAAGFKATLAG
ncbi:MAG TPA: hypothetical protein VK912_10670 [Longimicrobiales bacterium]|nr:hypothetical protein [Longimicrobiales bacterium]